MIKKNIATILLLSTIAWTANASRHPLTAVEKIELDLDCGLILQQISSQPDNSISLAERSARANIAYLKFFISAADGLKIKINKLYSDSWYKRREQFVLQRFHQPISSSSAQSKYNATEWADKCLALAETRGYFNAK